MKKIVIILISIMICMVYISCNKDDDENAKETISNYKEMIVGTWSVSYNDGWENMTDIITFNGVNGYFEARCSLSTYRGEYSVIENVINLRESTGKYPLDVIYLKSMSKSSFVGQTDYVGEVKGTRIN